MSRPQGSSRHQSSRSNDTSTEGYVEQVKGVITTLYDVALTRPHQWQTYLESARSAVRVIEHIRFFRNPNRLAEQIWMLDGLQEYAFHDPDSGSIEDIATFCQTSWLRILRDHPDDLQILSGLGRNWLQRAQLTLTQIHASEEAAGSSGSSEGNPYPPYEYEYDDNEKAGSPQVASDPRRQLPLYVEARGYLLPAVDFYTRAVRAADALGTTTGDLLATAAQAQMSLGNVTASPEDSNHFASAVRYLRRAAAIPEYALSMYLQGYLDDYGRYVV